MGHAERLETNPLLSMSDVGSCKERSEVGVSLLELLLPLNGERRDLAGGFVLGVEESLLFRGEANTADVLAKDCEEGKGGQLSSSRARDQVAKTGSPSKSQRCAMFSKVCFLPVQFDADLE